MSQSILILGGGCFGLTAAIELRQRGWQVTLVDQGPVPHPDAASTDISKVVRMDYAADAQHTEMGRASIEGWHRWNAAWGSEVYHEDGFLVMSREKMRPGGFEHDSLHHLNASGDTLHRIDSALLRANHPQWRADAYAEGYLNPRAGWVESGRATALLAEDARRCGVVLLENVAGARPLFSADRCVGIEAADGRKWSAELVLVAAGAWTPVLVPHLQKWMHATAQTVFHFAPAEPEKWRAPSFPVWGADIAKTGWYGFPANAAGIVKVANHGPGRRVLATQARELPAGEEERYRAFLRDTFPALAEAPLHSYRVCLYCDTFDGAFWIDHDREIAGLVVAAGDSGHAFKFTPVLGGLIADVVERKANPWATRYAWREPQGHSSDGARATAHS